MQSAPHVPDPAAPSANAAPSPVDVVVVTGDDILLSTLQEAVTAEHALWPAPSADAAVDLLLHGRCGILIADLGTLGTEAAALLARLHAQFPELVLLATGRREEEGNIASLVADGRVYRLLHKPISPARAAVFLSAATRRHQELRAEQATMLSTMRTLARRPESRRLTRILGGVLAIVALAAIVWVVHEHAAEGDVAAVTRAHEPTTEEQIADLLGRARIAQATGRLAEPRGDNAIEYYRAVLALDRTNSEANEALDELFATLEARVAEALRTRNARAARVALDSLRNAHPRHPQLPALQQQLAALLRAQQAAPPPPAPATEATPAPEPEPAELEESLALDMSATDDAPSVESLGEEEAVTAVESEIDRRYQDAMEQLALAIRLREREQLLEPSENNAFDALQGLASQYPDIEAIQAERRQLALRFLDLARTALGAADFERAETFLDRAERLVPGMVTTRGLRTRLEEQRREKALAEAIVPAGGLRRIREVRPQYPREAELRGIEGWVDIEFTIEKDGSTANLVVREANPPGVFERSALEALRRWRFEPIVRDGEPVVQRASLRMKYALK